jgi:ketosteroid isomerase-like protein
VDTKAAALRWARAWETAWREHDADAVGRLYAPDAVFRSSPFVEPHEGAIGARAYAAWAFDSESAADVEFGAPVMVASDRAAVEYWAVSTDKQSGGVVTIAGVSLLRFDDDGRVVEQRDYWMMEPGRNEPHSAWGR